MSIRTTALAALALLAAACGTPEPTTPTTEPPPAPATTTTVPPAFVEALNAIDPAIVDGNPQRAYDRARNVCSKLTDFPAEADQVEQTRLRFDTSPEVSAQVLDAIKTHVC